MLSSTCGAVGCCAVLRAWLYLNFSYIPGITRSIISWQVVLALFVHSMYHSKYHSMAGTVLLLIHQVCSLLGILQESAESQKMNSQLSFAQLWLNSAATRCAVPCDAVRCRAMPWFLPYWAVLCRAVIYFAHTAVPGIVRKLSSTRCRYARV